MSNPQAGIFAVGCSAHLYMEFLLAHTSDLNQALVELVNDDILHAGESGVNTVIGIRPSAWRSHSPDDLPDSLQDFSHPITGADSYTMPATQRDIWIWISGSSTSSVFDASSRCLKTLSPFAALVEEFHGWHYRHNRDLTGFVDGSANPGLLEAAAETLIPSGQPGEGGSVLLFQKWRHDLRAFEALTLTEQERVIGRTKSESQEFEEDKLPRDSHVARTTLEKDGHELPIWRRNTAFGTPSFHGTVFVGFSKDQARLHEMLERMAGIPDGIRDALTYFTFPLTGSYYFVPSADSLARYMRPAK